jgi:hypothetical protein
VVRQILRELFGGVPVRFASAHSLQESIERLRLQIETKRSAFAGLFQSKAVGQVTEQRVRLQRVYPFFGNSFRRVFQGRFRHDTDGVILVGRFTMTLLAKVFAGLWLGFGVLWMVFTTVMAAATAFAPIKTPELYATMLMPLFGLAVLALGYWMMRSSSRWNRIDIEFLSDVIARALNAGRMLGADK